VEEVERPFQELVAEQGKRDVPVERGQHGTHEQGEEAPEQDRVHDARIGLRERAHLAERVSQDQAHALRDSIQAVLGEPTPPETYPLPYSIREDGDRQRSADVERDLSPAGDVPEGVAERNRRGHERLNLSTRRHQTRGGRGGQRPPRTTEEDG